MEDEAKIKDVLIEIDRSCLFCHPRTTGTLFYNKTVINTMCSGHLLRLIHLYQAPSKERREIEAEIKKRNLHVE